MLSPSPTLSPSQLYLSLHLRLSLDPSIDPHPHSVHIHGDDRIEESENANHRHVLIQSPDEGMGNRIQHALSTFSPRFLTKSTTGRSSHVDTRRIRHGHRDGFLDPHSHDRFSLLTEEDELHQVRRDRGCQGFHGLKR